MRSRGLAGFAFITIAASVAAAPSHAQRPEHIRIMVPLGPSLLAPGRFSQAYDGGTALGVTVAVPVARRVWLRGGFEGQHYPYDEARFFTRMGMPDVDPSSQLGEYATLWSWFAGPELALSMKGQVQWYALVTVGGAVRRPQGLLVYMYCAPMNVFTVVGDTIRSVPRTPPPSCADARAETAISGFALGAELGAGLRWHQRRSFAFLETGVAGWLLSPAMATVPIRAGWGWGF